MEDPTYRLKAGTKLPFSRLKPLVAGALAGIALRLIYWGGPGHSFAAMMASFIYLAPLIVGAVTVFVAEQTARRSWSYYFAASFLANVFFVLGTLAIMVEGLICAVVIVPVFAVFGALGGFVMGAACRLTNWPKQTLCCLSVLPLVFGWIETDLPVPVRTRIVERSIFIQASPEKVWDQIQNATAIQPSEVEDAWLFRIGVPLPEAGIARVTSAGRVRTLSMGKSVHFEQAVTDWQVNRHVRWAHHYSADSFPPYALDEHVVLGGHYFDVSNSAYTLSPRDGGTELHIQLQYRVSTQFNWYADPVARLLLENLGDVVLNFYRHRCESDQLVQRG